MTTPDEQIPATEAESSGFDPRDALSNCPVPVRAINAAEPYETQIETNRKYCPSFDAVTMESVGHFLMLERPDEFNRVLRATLAELSRVTP